MPNAMPWNEVLAGIERTLAEVENAAAARERELEQPQPAPLAPESDWERRLRAWDAQVAKLPEAAQEAERECRLTEAGLGREEESLRTRLHTLHALHQRLAAWDAAYGAGRHTIRRG